MGQRRGHFQPMLPVVTCLAHFSPDARNIRRFLTTFTHWRATAALYTGSTNRLVRQLEQHASGRRIGGWRQRAASSMFPEWLSAVIEWSPRVSSAGIRLVRDA